MLRLECSLKPGGSFKIIACGLENPRHSSQLLTMIVDVQQTFPKLYVTTNIYVKHRQHLMFLYGTTFEYCEFLMRNESRQTNPVAVLVYNYAKHNFPHVLRPCPVLGIYNVSGLPVDKNLIPPFVTPGVYSATQTFHDKRNASYFGYDVEFSVFVKKFQCVGQPYAITKLHYCHVETFRNGTQVAGVVVEMLTNLQKVYVTLGLYTQYFRSRTQLLATSLEYCHQANNNQLLMGNAAAKFALEYAQQHFPQLIVDCPIRAGQLFNITGVRIADSMIPVFVIPGTYYIFLKRFECVRQPYKITKLHYCHLETFRNGTQVADVVLEVLNNLHKMFVTFGIYLQYLRSRTQLLVASIEYCQRANSNQLSMGNAAAKFTLDYAQQHFPQLLTDCPVRAGHMFNVTGLRITDSIIPVFVISGTYYMELRAYNKRNQTIYYGWLEADIKY
uniref:Uncharacterized protein n=1 Tax=Anopheles minimus TaxID=112268 RepID=A0A182VYC6_9DIPT